MPRGFLTENQSSVLLFCRQDLSDPHQNGTAGLCSHLLTCHMCSSTWFADWPKKRWEGTLPWAWTSYAVLGGQSHLLCLQHMHSLCDLLLYWYINMEAKGHFLPFGKHTMKKSVCRDVGCWVCGCTLWVEGSVCAVISSVFAIQGSLFYKMCSL